jgi:hypothetical protein
MTSSRGFPARKGARRRGHRLRLEGDDWGTRSRSSLPQAEQEEQDKGAGQRAGEGGLEVGGGLLPGGLGEGSGRPREDGGREDGQSAEGANERAVRRVRARTIGLASHLSPPGQIRGPNPASGGRIGTRPRRRLYTCSHFSPTLQFSLTSQFSPSSHFSLPAKFAADMRNIALATLAGGDALVSWNFRDVVRLEKIRLKLSQKRWSVGRGRPCRLEGDLAVGLRPANQKSVAGHFIFKRQYVPWTERFSR